MNKKNNYNDYYELSERDFYPPEDNRTIETNIEERYNGEFFDYANEYFDYINTY